MLLHISNLICSIIKSFVGCQYKLVYQLSRVNHPALQKGDLPEYISCRRDLAR